ncbi:hypothetical protein [Sphaerisporangium perillae]|nr:hypothetical protein [Sphaerisporangium perillae]
MHGDHPTLLAGPGSPATLSIVLTAVAVFAVASLLIYRFVTRRRRSR